MSADRGRGSSGGWVVVGMLAAGLLFVGMLFWLGDPKPRMVLDPATGKPLDPDRASRPVDAPAEGPKILALDELAGASTHERQAAEAARDAKADLESLDRAIQAEESGGPPRRSRLAALHQKRGLLRLKSGDRPGAEDDLAAARALGVEPDVLRRALGEAEAGTER